MAFLCLAVQEPVGCWTLCSDTMTIRQSRPENPSTNASSSLKYADPCGTSMQAIWVFPRGSTRCPVGSTGSHLSWSGSAGADDEESAPHPRSGVPSGRLHTRGIPGHASLPAAGVSVPHRRPQQTHIWMGASQTRLRPPDRAPVHARRHVRAASPALEGVCSVVGRCACPAQAGSGVPEAVG
jgi:hypothetical protein